MSIPAQGLHQATHSGALPTRALPGGGRQSPWPDPGPPSVSPSSGSASPTPSPTPPGPAPTSSRYGPCPGGGPANTAVALARLGTRTRFLGRLSTDVFGTLFRARLSASGVDPTGSVTAPEPSTFVVADLDETGRATYTFYADGASAVLPPSEADTVSTRLRAVAHSCDSCHCCAAAAGSPLDAVGQLAQEETVLTRPRPRSLGRLRQGLGVLVDSAKASESSADSPRPCRCGRDAHCLCSPGALMAVGATRFGWTAVDRPPAARPPPRLCGRGRWPRGCLR